MLKSVKHDEGFRNEPIVRQPEMNRQSFAVQAHLLTVWSTRCYVVGPFGCCAAGVPLAFLMPLSGKGERACLSGA